jgi:hypothetical protein
MAKPVVGLALRDRLGDSGARELNEFVGRHCEDVRSDMVAMCNTRVTNVSTEITERFADVRTEMTERIGDLKTDLSERLARLRVELLRWTFMFWIGQFTAMLAALVAAMAVFAQWIRP